MTTYNGDCESCGKREGIHWVDGRLLCRRCTKTGDVGKPAFDAVELAKAVIKVARGAVSGAGAALSADECARIVQAATHAGRRQMTPIERHMLAAKLTPLSAAPGDCAPCIRVSREIYEQFGFPIVGGAFDCVPGEFWAREGHYWNQAEDGTIVDASVVQFVPTMRVVVISPDDPLYARYLPDAFMTELVALGHRPKPTIR